MRLDKRFWILLAALVLLAAACNSGGGTDTEENGDQQAEEGGEAIEVAAVWTGAEQERFTAVLEAFTEETGIEASYRSAGDDMAAFLGTQIEGGNPPDVAIVAQPALVEQLADDGSLQPLDEDVVAGLDENFATVWKDIGSVDGEPYAVYFKVANKSTWWYNTAVFEQAGVEPPQDWDELLETAQTVNSSGTPFVSIGGADGWTLTDWFENIYIRTAGPEAYDQLTNHEIPWTDDTVKTALETWGELVGDEANLAGGTNGALNTTFEESVTQTFADPPAAATVYEADFVAGIISADTNAQAEQDFNFFTFPTIDGSAPAVVSAGDGAVVLSDNPSAQRFAEFLTTPEAAEVWASEGGFISPNENLDTSVYPDDISREIGEAVVAAGEDVRFDMSDLVPPEFGGTTGQGLWKLFQDFVKDPSDVNGVTRELEAAARRAYS
ncbi:MAG TPA: ABC transporter substrate-binding protein [Actinomycetota bacterium]|nr:ABC transporter substrate-binding protein [Actinomycetota bacterium]